MGQVNIKHFYFMKQLHLSILFIYRVVMTIVIFLVLPLFSMVRDPVKKFVSRYHYNRLVSIYKKLVTSKSPVIRNGSITEQVK